MQDVLQHVTIFTKGVDLLFHNLKFNENTGIPEIQGGFKTDQSLNVKLHFCAKNVPLLAWFTKGNVALETFLAYLRVFKDSQNDILKECSI